MYGAIIENQSTRLARFLEPKFCNNVIVDCNLLRQHVILPDLKTGIVPGPELQCKRSTVSENPDRNNRSAPMDDDVTLFLRDTFQDDASLTVLD